MEVRAYYRALRREQVNLTWRPAPAAPGQGGQAHRVASPRPAQTTWESPAAQVAFRNGMARKGSSEAGISWLLGDS